MRFDDQSRGYYCTYENGKRVFALKQSLFLSPGWLDSNEVKKFTETWKTDEAHNKECFNNYKEFNRHYWEYSEPLSCWELQPTPNHLGPSGSTSTSNELAHVLSPQHRSKRNIVGRIFK
ncbi:hypothetical protein T439DRAFT_328168 [Meredithblackwellia eburnea MCA 4105]